ncbi:hypothetical protein K461DRAFT_272971 [Myriangium duriaei CBS 260.36]|uniref:TUG ubiquitin-like domain-containing protein n=1 Tax=Myriangium duriaei CBS 260.36 TaxID=1168546 RepID=A0A9P4J8H9_9PEZI|nr:hypothetical protein K461DRAFT_272971 [Myriangium duriaei CBS 260.36]
MASHVFVIDSSARRQQVKTSPGTYLRDVLEEACKKFGKDPEQFVLTDSSRPPKTLDLSLTLRLSGLVNGARLQLVQASRSPSVINVALKLPPSVGGGQRLQDKFPSNTSLWLVLRKFEEAVAGGSQKLNLTQRGVPSTESGPGRLEYEQPVVKIMQRELADFIGLQKSLAQLGYNNGSVLLQLDFKRTGIPMEEAVTKISQYFGAPDPTAPIEQASQATSQIQEQSAPAGAHAGSVADMSSVPNVDAENAAAPTDSETAPEPSEDLAMPDAPSAPSEVQPAEETGLIASSTITPAQPVSEATTSTSQTTPSRTPDPSPAPTDSISVYKPPSGPTPRAALQSSSESDFIPTIEHAHAHQAVLNRAAQNQRLLSDAEVAAEASRKQDALQSVHAATVRVRFPDQMQVDLTVDSDATAASLYARVADMLHDSGLGFELRYTGAKGAPVTLAREGAEAAKKLIRGLGWKGRVLVTMVWAPDVPLEKRGRVLKDSLVGQAKELSVPTPVAGGDISAKGVGDRVEKPKEQGKGGNKGDLEAKMKKFLGFGKGKK